MLRLKLAGLLLHLQLLNWDSGATILLYLLRQEEETNQLWCM